MRRFTIESFRPSELERWIDHAVDPCAAARKVQALRRVHA